MLAIIVILAGLVVCVGGGFIFYVSCQCESGGFCVAFLAFIIFALGITLIVSPILGWVDAVDTKANYDTYVEYVETTKIQLESDEAALRAECVEWLANNKDMNVDDSVSFDSMLSNVPELKVLLGQKLTDYTNMQTEYNRIQSKVDGVAFDKIFYWPW